jgi:hypothetical protein
MGISFPNLVGWPEEIESDNFMKVRFTNLGTQTVIIKPRTLQVEYQDKVFVLGNEDFIGMDEFDEVLIPMSSRSIGVFQSMILSELDITSPKTYDDESFNKLYPLKISVQDHHGKKFTDKRYSYHEAVCEYVI